MATAEASPTALRGEQHAGQRECSTPWQQAVRVEHGAQPSHGMVANPRATTGRPSRACRGARGFATGAHTHNNVVVVATGGNERGQYKRF